MIIPSHYEGMPEPRRGWVIHGDVTWCYVLLCNAFNRLFWVPQTVPNSCSVSLVKFPGRWPHQLDHIALIVLHWGHRRWNTIFITWNMDQTGLGSSWICTPCRLYVRVHDFMRILYMYICMYISIFVVVKSHIQTNAHETLFWRIESFFGFLRSNLCNLFEAARWIQSLAEKSDSRVMTRSFCHWNLHLKTWSVELPALKQPLIGW